MTSSALPTFWWLPNGPRDQVDDGRHCNHRAHQQAAEFRAVGRIPLVQGWKAAFGAADPGPGREKEGEADAEQALPQCEV